MPLGFGLLDHFVELNIRMLHALSLCRETVAVESKIAHGIKVLCS